jgi:hypothetical protein
MKWLVVVLICAATIGCNRTDSGASLDPGQLGLSQAEFDRLRMVAIEAARKENFDVRATNFKLAKEGEQFKALFTQKTKDALGGELHVVMEKSGRILRVYRGA